MAELISQVLLALVSGHSRPPRPLLPLALIVILALPLALLALVFLALAGYFALEPVTSPAVAAALISALLLLAATITLLVLLLKEQRPPPQPEVPHLLRSLLDRAAGSSDDDGDEKAGFGFLAPIAVAGGLGLALGYSPALRRLVATLAGSLIKDLE